MSEIFQDGYCLAHGKHWQDCAECREAYQRESMRRWAEKWRVIAEDYRHYHAITEPIYVMLLGNPKEIEGKGAR